MKKPLLFALLMLAAGGLGAQVRRTPLHFPDADGYRVLKGDFHIHTVFSDGNVWPTARVEEAYMEDLDVIALTEHIEHRPHLDEMTSRDHNRSYEIAKEAAERFGIVLIRGTEITRGMPPGHLNAVGIQDANVFETYVNPDNTRDSARVAEALAEARRQGAFVFWNHPAFPTPDNRSTWHPMHQRLLDAGLMMGIEVVNGERYEPVAFQWCLDNNLTILSNTDAHATMGQKRSADDSRVMTLVLARDKTQESVMEALATRRTIALWNNRLMGRREHVAPVVAAAVEARLTERGGQYLFEWVNRSDFPFTLEIVELPAGFRVRDDVPVNVHPGGVLALTANVREGVPQSLRVRVLNVETAPGQPLEMEIPVRLLR